MKLPEPSSGSYELCPAGNHLAVCNRLIDLGTQKVDYEGQVKMQRKIFIGWVIPAETTEDGRPFGIGKRYTLSMHEKSAMRKDLESWRGKKFTAEELGPQGTFNLENLIGKACFLSVVHNTRDQKTYANINAVASLPKGMTAPTGDWEECFLSLEPDEFEPIVFDTVGERLRETIKTSPEFQALPYAGGKPQRQAKPAGVHPASEADDLPF